jgi:hypothetical protein
MDLASLSNDELIDQVTTWAGRVAAGEARLLALVGELDAREAWAGHGVRSCVHWLSWKIGWTPTTARERVRVARALRELPLTAEALGAGRVSYAQVRALTRFVTAVDEDVWLDLARHSTAAQLEKAARGAARAKALEQAPDERAVKPATSLRWDDNGDLVLTLRFPAHEGVAVLAALEQVQAAEQAERDERTKALALELAALQGASAEASVLMDPSAYVDPPFPVLAERAPFADQSPAEKQAIDDWWTKHDRLHALRVAAEEQAELVEAVAAARHLPIGRASLADALFRALLHPRAGQAATKVQLLVDPVSGWARTHRDELLPPATLKQVLRTLPGDHRLPKVRPLHAADLTRHDLGRRSRLVSPALRALLGQVDGERCRFPGCDHTRFLHAHHLVFWRNGGRTDLSNIVLLCTRHHTLLHQAGYDLRLADDRTLTVRAPDGRLLEHHPALPPASAEALPLVAADALPSRWGGEKLDVGYVVNVLLQRAA